MKKPAPVTINPNRKPYEQPFPPPRGMYWNGVCFIALGDPEPEPNKERGAR